MISFAGVSLRPITDPDVKAYVARWADAHAANMWDRPYSTLTVAHYPPARAPQTRPPRPGVLVWPNGAHRMAEFCEFVTGEQADAIYAAVIADPNFVGTLVLSDGAGGTVTAVNMELLGFQPVFQSGSDELYLMYLTDYRQAWWNNGGTITASSWADAIRSVNPVPGPATWSVGTIPSAYQLPDANHWGFPQFSGDPGAIQCEAVTRQCGMRLTLRPADGVLAVNTYTTASALDISQWTTYRGKVAIGGRWSVRDMNRFVPTTVTVKSYRTVQGGTAAPQGGSTVRSLSGLALSEYEGYAGGVGGAALIVHDCTNTISSPDFTAYATQAATDWYLWQLSLTDATFKGIVPWVPTGLEDRIEWVHDWNADAIYTRVVPAPRHPPSAYGTLGFRPMPPIPLTATSLLSPEFSTGPWLTTGPTPDGYWGVFPIPATVPGTGAIYGLQLTDNGLGGFSLGWSTLPP